MLSTRCPSPGGEATTEPTRCASTAPSAAGTNSDGTTPAWPQALPAGSLASWC